MSEEKDDKELSELAVEEITKATISQSIGTVIFPITKEIAKLEEAGIKKLKSYIRDFRKKKLGQQKIDVVERAIAEAEQNPEKLLIVMKLHEAFEIASEQEIESNDEIFKLWCALIDKITKNWPETDLLIEKLRSLNPLEAKFLLNFDNHKKQHIFVNSFLRSLYVGSARPSETLKDEQIAISLSEKGLIYQQFSVQKVITLVLLPIVVLLIVIELLRSFLMDSGVNPSSANNVILVAVIGVVFGLVMVTRLRHPLVLTWIGKKLLDGATEIGMKWPSQKMEN